MSYGVEIYGDDGKPRVQNSHNCFMLDYFLPTASGSKSYSVAADEELLVTVMEYDTNYYAGSSSTTVPGVVADVSVSGNTVTWTYILGYNEGAILERAGVLMVYKRGKV